LSSEKNDMQLTNSAADLAPSGTRYLRAAELPGLASVPYADRPHTSDPSRTPHSTVELSLRCVWTSYPTHDRSCHTRVPIRVVTQAWKRELSRGRAHEGFFHFSWDDEVWLAYGLANGRVRGVYCPEHAAERDEHTSAPV
jgi:hypothetical protein